MRSRSCKIDAGVDVCPLLGVTKDMAEPWLDRLKKGRRGKNCGEVKFRLSPALEGVFFTQKRKYVMARVVNKSVSYIWEPCFIIPASKREMAGSSSSLLLSPR